MEGAMLVIESIGVAPTAQLPQCSRKRDRLALLNIPHDDEARNNSDYCPAPVRFASQFFGVCLESRTLSSVATTALSAHARGKT